MPDTNELYQRKYPHELPMHNRFFTLQPGEILVDKQQKRYQVNRVIVSPIPGRPPAVEIEQLSSSEETEGGSNPLTNPSDVPADSS